MPTVPYDPGKIAPEPENAYNPGIHLDINPDQFGAAQGRGMQALAGAVSTVGGALSGFANVFNQYKDQNDQLAATKVTNDMQVKNALAINNYKNNNPGGLAEPGLPAITDQVAQNGNNALALAQNNEQRLAIAKVVSSNTASSLINTGMFAQDEQHKSLLDTSNSALALAAQSSLGVKNEADMKPIFDRQDEQIALQAKANGWTADQIQQKTDAERTRAYTGSYLTQAVDDPKGAYDRFQANKDNIPQAAQSELNDKLQRAAATYSAPHIGNMTNAPKTNIPVTKDSDTIAPLPRVGQAATAEEQGVNSDLADIVARAGTHLPAGYHAEIFSGARPNGPESSQHHDGNAVDVQIVGPDGPVKGSAGVAKGDDTTGMYTDFAKAANAEQLAHHPDLNGKLAWGGHFGTELGGGGPKDLMHFDLGGDRGRYGRMADLSRADTTTPAPLTRDSFVNALNQQESGGGKTSTNVGQIQPETWAHYAHPNEDINNPADNKAVVGRIVDDLASKYKLPNGQPDWDRVAVGYFGGPGKVAPAGSATPWTVDSADANGKHISSYVADMQGRMKTGNVDTTPKGPQSEQETIDGAKNRVNQMYPAGQYPEKFREDVQTASVSAALGQYRQQQSADNDTRKNDEQAVYKASLDAGTKNFAQLLENPETRAHYDNLDSKAQFAMQSMFNNREREGENNPSPLRDANAQVLSGMQMANPIKFLNETSPESFAKYDLTRSQRENVINERGKVIAGQVNPLAGPVNTAVNEMARNGAFAGTNLTFKGESATEPEETTTQMFRGALLEKAQEWQVNNGKPPQYADMQKMAAGLFLQHEPSYWQQLHGALGGKGANTRELNVPESQRLIAQSKDLADYQAQWRQQNPFSPLPSIDDQLRDINAHYGRK
jgi:hypothetical protein